MQNLNNYFSLFDEARTDPKAKEDLIKLFTEDMSFVLAGYKKTGIEELTQFLNVVFANHSDLKHLYQGWVLNETTGQYETQWAICGKRKDGSVYAQTGKDIAELDSSGKIKYLENVPDNVKMFDAFKKS